MLAMGPLRKLVPKAAFRDLWQRVRDSQVTGERACASCRRPLQVVTVDAHDGEVELDVCRSCQLVWFDPGEMDSMAAEAEEAELNPEVSNQLKQAMLPYEMDKIGGMYAHEQPTEKNWKQEKWGAYHSAWLDRTYDLPVEHRRSGLAGFPLMSWTLTMAMTAGVILPLLDPALWGEIWAYDSTRPELP
jgi:Zn-finger nucleic acid-binding protein